MLTSVTSYQLSGVICMLYYMYRSTGLSHVTLGDNNPVDLVTRGVQHLTKTYEQCPPSHSQLAYFIVKFQKCNSGYKMQISKIKLQ